MTLKEMTEFIHSLPDGKDMFNIVNTGDNKPILAIKSNYTIIPNSIIISNDFKEFEIKNLSEQRAEQLKPKIEELLCYLQLQLRMRK